MLCWRVGDVYAYYNSGFDPDWSKQSVGTVVMGIAIREAIHEEAKVFDMLEGGETYKRKFADKSRPAATFVLTPSKDGSCRATRRFAWLAAGKRISSAAEFQAPFVNAPLVKGSPR